MSRSPKPKEVELKLRLPGPTTEITVVEKLRNAGYVIKRRATIHNSDLYLDTFDWLLMKNNLSLRYRTANGKAMYTLKSIESFDNGIANRTEVEIAVDGQVAAPQEIPVKQIRKEVMPLIFPRCLMELVRVRTIRHEYPVTTPEGAAIGLVFDTSSFSRARRPVIRCNQKLYEMEAELQKGSSAALKSLQQLLIQEPGYQPSSESKLQCGISLLKITPFRRSISKEVSVQLDDSIEIAMRKIIAAESLWFKQQLPGVTDDIDPEYVHQARVTTRRMRSAVKVFNDAAPKATRTFLADELKWLGGLFGSVRDIDVFTIGLNNLKSEIEHFPAQTRRGLQENVEKQRQKPFDDLIDGLNSPRFKTLARRIEQFIKSPPETNPEGVTLKTIRQFAPQVISDDFQAVLEQGSSVLKTPEMKQFHLLRIEMKKLRYAMEFMAPAYGEKLSPFIKGTVEIQDCLGELQDTVFTREFCMQLIDEWKRKTVDSDLLFVLGEIYNYQADIARKRREMFAGIWERFSSQDNAAKMTGAFKENTPPQLPK